MSPPQQKRGTSEEETGDEVCKRLKSETKPTTEPNDDPKHNISNNNNNNNNDANGNKHQSSNNNNNSNKTEQQPDAKVNDKGEKLNGEVKEEKNKVDDDHKRKPTSENQNGKKEVKDDEEDEEGEEEDQEDEEEDGGEEEEEVDEKKSSATTDNKTSASKPPEPEEEPSGMLLICGGANWDMTGRKELPKTAKKPVEVDPAARNLWGPHKVLLDGYNKPLRVRGIFSGCNACHSVIVTDEGVAMTFGRNDKGQLGLGDTATRVTPCVVEALKGINVVAAACGRSHTLFLSSDGIVFSCGDNKMGQCGTNQMAVQQITVPQRIAFKENRPVVKIACGAEFSMIVDIEAKLYSFGHPEHGQLGHNSEGKYFTTGNKYAFHCEYAPRRITTFIEKSREGHVSPVDDVQIVDIACGTNHTLAVDKKRRCFSWGFAGYHRLGHCDTKNELVPRSIKVFDAPGNADRGATRVFAGATHSMALDVNGLLYFWGQNKSSGEATMYPKNVQDLCGWRIRAVACANRSIFVVADESCISWGPSPTYGELGYGEGKSKSSTVPQEVKTLEGVYIMSVACGFGHTLLVARDASQKEQATLEKFKNWP